MRCWRGAVRWRTNVTTCAHIPYQQSTRPPQAIYDTSLRTGNWHRTPPYRPALPRCRCPGTAGPRRCGSCGRGPQHAHGSPSTRAEGTRAAVHTVERTRDRQQTTQCGQREAWDIPDLYPVPMPCLRVTKHKCLHLQPASLVVLHVAPSPPAAWPSPTGPRRRWLQPPESGRPQPGRIRATEGSEGGVVE